jgi:hypothetical protein
MDGKYIEWKGLRDKSPVPAGTRVDIVLRGGTVSHDRTAEYLRWSGSSDADDIVAYRIHDPDGGWIIREEGKDFDSDDVPDDADGECIDIVARHPQYGVEYHQDPQDDVDWSIDKNDLHPADIIEWRITPKVDITVMDEDGYFKHDSSKSMPNAASGIFVDIIETDGVEHENEQADDWDWDDDSRIYKWRPHRFKLDAKYTAHDGEGLPEAVEGKQVNIVYRDYDAADGVDADDYNWEWGSDHSTGDIMGYQIIDATGDVEPTHQTDDERWTAVDPGEKPDFDDDVKVHVKLTGGSTSLDAGDDFVRNWGWSLSKGSVAAITHYKVSGPWVEHDGRSVPLHRLTRIIAVDRTGYQYSELSVGGHSNEMTWAPDSKRASDIVRYVVTQRCAEDKGWVFITPGNKPDLPKGTKIIVRLAGHGTAPTGEPKPVDYWGWAPALSGSIVAYKIVEEKAGADAQLDKMLNLAKAILREKGTLEANPREATVIVHDLDYEGQVLEGKWHAGKNLFVMENGDEYEEQFLRDKGAIIYERH